MFKNITSALIACGLVTPVWAATDAISDDPFFTDSQLTVSAKNYWKYLKEENANPKHVHNAWGQGFSAEYQSGYFADIIGFDVSYYSAIKLGASDYFNSRGVLYNNGTGNKKSNAEGYSKFGQRNVKLNYTLSGAQLNARWGWQMLKNYGVISTSNRLSPTTYSGVSSAVSYGPFTIRGAWLENSMDRNSPDKKQFQTNTGKYISHLASGEVLWRGEKFDAQYAYGESKNYLQRHKGIMCAPGKSMPLAVGFQRSPCLKTSPFGRCSGRDGHIRRKVKRQSLRTVIIHVQTRCRRK